MRSAFNQHLDDLEQDLLTMSDMVITAIQGAVLALNESDIGKAKQVKRNDIHINRKRWEIEEKCINLIATQQPVATDLRELIAVLNIITDFERMGDYASGIAGIVVKTSDKPKINTMNDINKMAEIAVDMIQKSNKAYAKRDNTAARLICSRDDDVDDLYHKILRVLLSDMIENPENVTRSTYLIWVAHNLERIADRVTNICERIIFLVTGDMIENVS